MEVSYFCCCIKRSTPKHDVNEEDAEIPSVFSGASDKDHKKTPSIVDPKNPSRLYRKGPLTEMQSKRARNNWEKLRVHIRQMKNKANFLVKYLEDENELKQEHIYGTDTNNKKNKGQFASKDNVDEDEEQQEKGGCLKNIIIDPSKNSWLGTWKFIIHCLMFIGYYNDPIHAAFFIGFENQPPGVKIIGENYKVTLMFEMIVDCCMAFDIILNFITAFYRDMEIENDILEIFKNYAFGFFIFDITATVPGFFVKKINGLYWFRFIRFAHARAVYSSISSGMKAIMLKFGLNK
jgi:hypothetical protein